MTDVPLVSFIVPCYKYAHYLSQCITSILSQTCDDCELLVLDDCSPDNTPEVVAQFSASRVKHIRHQTRLGAVRNFNAGLRIALGKYIWIISADDWLSSDEILSTYVAIMESNPAVGFIYSNAIKAAANAAGIMGNRIAANEITILRGSEFYERLLSANFVPAASVMVRKACYDEVGFYEESLPCIQDYEMWLRLALRYDVGYVPRESVCYRIHELSLSQRLSDVASSVEEGVRMGWLCLKQAQVHGTPRQTRLTAQAIADRYVWKLNIPDDLASDDDTWVKWFEASVEEHCQFAQVRDRLRYRVYRHVANQCLKAGAFRLAQRFYHRALASCARHPRTWFLSAIAQLGSALRKSAKTPIPRE